MILRGSSPSRAQNDGVPNCQRAKRNYQVARETASIISPGVPVHRLRHLARVAWRRRLGEVLADCPVQQALFGERRSVVVLLEEERDVVARTLVANVANPVEVHRATIFGGRPLAPDDDPVDLREVR